MHEASIVQELLTTAEQEVRRSGGTGRIVRLGLTVGRLSGAHPEALRFAFEILSEGTLAEGASLEICQTQAVCRCRSCGAQTQVEDIFALCCKCGSADVSIEGGRELLLDTIDVEEKRDHTSLKVG